MNRHQPAAPVPLTWRGRPALLVGLAAALLAATLIHGVSSTRAADPCPNEGFRTGPAANLGDCRAYEMVSPPNKNGAAVSLGLGTFRASSAGGAVLFDSNVAFGDAQGTGNVGAVTYRADRDASAWSTHSLMPPQDVNTDASLFGASYNWFSPDLSSGVLAAKDPVLVPGAPEGILNLYLMDGSGGSPKLLTPSETPVSHARQYFPFIVDVSQDETHAAFESTQNLTADAPPQPYGFYCQLSAAFCFPRLYEWDNGIVRLAGVLPNGTAMPEGAVAGRPFGQLNGADGDPTFSEDGSRLYFTSPAFGGGELYLRKNGSSTTWVSQSEASSPSEIPSEALFGGASADGTRSTFMTDQPLLNADEGTSTDLYMYTDGPDPENESNLTLISEDNEPSDGVEARVDGVLGMSRDGSRIYFAAESQIVSGEATSFGPKLYLWDHGVVRYVATLEGAYATQDKPNWNSEAIIRASRVTPDGRYLLFTTGGSQPGGFDNAEHKEIYRYNAQTNETTCVSCGTDLGPATADASINFPGTTSTRQVPTYAVHAMTDDGQRIFFNTAESLVAQDANGKVDAYQWEESGSGTCHQDRGCTYLLSSGRNEKASYFVDASANGNDAYVVTREALSPWDASTSDLDLYDMRAEGGLPGLPTLPADCQGEGCRGTSAPPAGGPSPTSTGFSGPGNINPARHRRHRKHRAKRHHRRSRQRATNNDLGGVK